MGLLPDYSRQAERYDASRSASPSILRVLRRALAGAPGRGLAAKGLQTMQADAALLPFADGSLDAVTMVSMLHHVEDPGTVLSEARRVLRARGRLAVFAYMAEDAATLAERGETSYFERMRRDHPEDLQAGLARLRRDITAGRAPSYAGTASVFSWTKE